MNDRNPLDNLPQRHEREALVQRAESDISAAISELFHRRELTYAELIGILARDITKWSQRQEYAERAASNEPQVSSPRCDVFDWQYRCINDAGHVDDHKFWRDDGETYRRPNRKDAP